MHSKLIFRLDMPKAFMIKKIIVRQPKIRYNSAAFLSLSAERFDYTVFFNCIKYLPLPNQLYPLGLDMSKVLHMKNKV